MSAVLSAEKSDQDASLGRQLRLQLLERRRRSIATFEAQGNTSGLLRALARDVDSVLAQCWRQWGMPAGAALVAVGGYGRGELFPYSDVDVLIVLRAPPDPILEGRIERLIGLFWDLGVELGHSVRTLAECGLEAERDITVQTSLLEARYVAGSRELFARLAEQVRENLDPRQFFRAKSLELQQRHARYHETAFALEPNCKESPGGLRDLQVILWISRAAGLGRSWAELAQGGLLTPVEARLLRRNELLLKLIRIRLHLIAGRREDRLVFDVQTTLAEMFGFRPIGVRRASEVLMQRYYWAAKTVTQLNDIVLQNIETRLFPAELGEPVQLNARFQIQGKLLDITYEEVFQNTPSALLEAFALMQQHSELKGMSARTLRALWHARTLIDAKFRRDPAHREQFLSLLKAPRGIVHELRRMNQFSILGRYLPVFRRIIGQMQHDLFHYYTVDQHILMVVRNLRRFTMVEFSHEYPLCSKLMVNYARHWVLYVAALFHDIAKGRGGDHSLLGERDARRFCRDHKISNEDSELIEFLVREHLTMSRIAQKEDMSDPEVIRDFAARVGDDRHLNGLYLLTVADIRGTSPKVWNAWKGKLLEDLYFRTLRALGGGKVSAHAELAYRQDTARRILSLYDFDQEAVTRFWAQLDIAWLLRHDAQDIAWITRSFALGADTDTPRVRARLSPLGEGLQVAVYTPDQPDLLARICEFFERNRFAVLDARVHTTKRNKGPNYALDTFHLADNGVGHYRDVIGNIQRGLAEHLSLAAPLSPPAKGRLSRQSQSYPITPTVDLRPDDRGQYYLLTLSSADRAGLLYAILRVFATHHVNVQTAKITTLGDRVEDFFLVDGEVLSNNKSQIRFETELLETLSA
ncbi:MAG: [protein-PII] uridylyltransferase [Burkholderiaceae bacterium]|jgi:[protein-PII] uridylyltransferase